jgi:hypothetical protein
MLQNLNPIHRFLILKNMFPLVDNMFLHSNEPIQLTLGRLLYLRERSYTLGLSQVLPTPKDGSELELKNVKIKKLDGPFRVEPRFQLVSHERDRATLFFLFTCKYM